MWPTKTQICDQVIWLTKKRNFDSLYKQVMWPAKKVNIYDSDELYKQVNQYFLFWIIIFPFLDNKNFPFGDFDWLYKQVIWLDFQKKNVDMYNN